VLSGAPKEQGTPINFSVISGCVSHPPEHWVRLINTNY